MFLIELVPELGVPRRERGIGQHSAYSATETMCDLAAAELLMPAQAFGQVAAEHEPSILSLLSLSRDFGTSLTATARRVIELRAWDCVIVWWSGIVETQVATRVRHKVVLRSPAVDIPLSEIRQIVNRQVERITRRSEITSDYVSFDGQAYTRVQSMQVTTSTREMITIVAPCKRTTRNEPQLTLFPKERPNKSGSSGFQGTLFKS